MDKKDITLEEMHGARDKELESGEEFVLCGVVDLSVERMSDINRLQEEEEAELKKDLEESYKDSPSIAEFKFKQKLEEREIDFYCEDIFALTDEEIEDHLDEDWKAFIKRHEDKRYSID